MSPGKPATDDLFEVAMHIGVCSYNACCVHHTERPYLRTSLTIYHFRTTTVTRGAKCRSRHVYTRNETCLVTSPKICGIIRRVSTALPSALYACTPLFLTTASTFPSAMAAFTLCKSSHSIASTNSSSSGKGLTLTSHTWPSSGRVPNSKNARA